MARLSLCMIVKDEAMFLPRCLASVRGVVDEIIVVDTGSTDGTPDLARRAGARVFHLPWRDDFAAARNYALAQATGSFVLVLDADEELGPGAGAALKKAIRRNDLDCGMLPLHNAKTLFAPVKDVVHGAQRIGDPTLLPRLLRRAPDLAWKGVVHESVGAWVAVRQTRVHAVKAPIVHWGAVAEVRESRRKSDRNMTLLRARCLAEPENPAPRQYLAAELITAGRATEAWPILDEGWRLLLRAMSGPPPFPAYVRLVSLRVPQQFAHGDVAGALETLRIASAWGDQHPNFDYLRARAHELTAATAADPASHLAAARRGYEAALTKDGLTWPEDVLPEITARIGHIRAGTIALQQGDPAAALAHLAPFAADRIPDARIAYAEALLASGQVLEALRHLERELPLPTPDAWILAADAAHTLGALGDAELFVAEATARGAKRAPLAPHRGDRLRVLQALVATYRGETPALEGPLAAFFAVIHRQPLPPTITPPRPLPAGFDDLVRNLARAQRVSALEALLERRAESVFPGCLAATSSAIASLGLDVEDDGEPAPIFVVGPGADAWVPTLDGHDALEADDRAAPDPGLRARVLAHARRPVHSALPADLAALLAAFPRGRAVGAGWPLDHERAVTVAATPTDGDLRRTLAFLGEAWDPGLIAGGAEVDDLLRSLLADGGAP